MAFDKIREQCEMNSAISARIIDDFLINYAAESENLPSRDEYSLRRFRPYCEPVSPSRRQCHEGPVYRASHLPPGR